MFAAIAFTLLIGSTRAGTPGRPAGTTTHRPMHMTATAFCDKGETRLGVDVGALLDGGAFGGYQRMLIALTALTIIFDGADNQLLGAALPAIMREWRLPRGAFAPALAAGLFGMMLGGALAGVFGDRAGR